MVWFWLARLKLLIDRLNGYYFSIECRGLNDNGLGRVFYIQQFKCNNSLKYVHRLRGLIFATEEECEQAIIKKLETEHGAYVDLEGRKRFGIKAYKYKRDE